MKYIVIVFIINFSLFGYAYGKQKKYCPISVGSYEPVVDVNIVKSKSGGQTFEYTLLNSKNSLLDIIIFGINTDNFISEEVGTPSNWNFKERPVNSRSQWITKMGYEFALKPNNSLSGFSLKSVSKIGVVEVAFRSSDKSRLNKHTKTLINTKKPCPGQWGDGSSADGEVYVKTITLGPLPENRLAPEMFIRKNQKSVWTGGYSQKENLIAIDPMEKTKIEILLIGSTDFNIASLDLNSLEFGRGKAKLIDSKIVNAKATGKLYKDILAKSYDNIVLTFDAQEANVLCDLDQALFLRGKTHDGKELYTGVKIRPTWCTEKNFIKETEKIHYF